MTNGGVGWGTDEMMSMACEMAASSALNMV